MGKRDYYEVLGIPRGATEDDIRKAYRRLAMKHHPDRTQGDKESEEKFKEIAEAYAVLTDPEKRANYDQFGHAGVGAGMNDFGFGSFGDIFGDIFEDFFGARTDTRRSRVQKGDDIVYNLDLTLEEAFEGFEREISIPRLDNCDICGGTGAEPGSGQAVCPVCRGAGRVRQTQGFFSITRTCHRCMGAGAVLENPCRKCKGEGRIRTTRKLRITVPAGVDNGSRIRYRGEGEAGARGGPNGDLYLMINVREHDFFKREGDNLICEVPVSFPQAALGAEIRVPTLDGKISLKIPKGTQSHHIFRVKGKGMPGLRSHGRGDLFVRAVIETPTKLNDRQRELLEEFAKISGEETQPLTKKFLDKFKEVFGT
ncbi:MAG: molecular chaperone DnaJ [Candidatus Abyssobacteria bacterium SURF_5]|uniref:Chaperone protein DnaJ n=1 Tax=Abyssobacteria bacterium (strain SURF_5) TaxID=2093360 RepID=A0A3A4P6E4_ABYX5|nr:MAG: molecular chaperone DnaJ [Candidatus Abyssubacteria bacterium SURF_5]